MQDQLFLELVTAFCDLSLPLSKGMIFDNRTLPLLLSTVGRKFVFYNFGDKRVAN